MQRQLPPGRPKRLQQDRSVKITITLPYSLAELLKPMANRSAFIARLIAEYFERLRER